MEEREKNYGKGREEKRGDKKEKRRGGEREKIVERGEKKKRVEPLLGLESGERIEALKKRGGGGGRRGKRRGEGGKGEGERWEQN